MGVIGIPGLFMTAEAHDSPFGLAGLWRFLFGALFDFALIHRLVGRHDSF